jgi:hypothetical protein
MNSAKEEANPPCTSINVNPSHTASITRCTTGNVPKPPRSFKDTKGSISMQTIARSIAEHVLFAKSKHYPPSSKPSASPQVLDVVVICGLLSNSRSNEKRIRITTSGMRIQI